LLKHSQTIDNTQNRSKNSIHYVTVQRNDIEILLIDDISDIEQPCGRLFIRDWTLELNSNTQAQVLFSTRLEIDYYNNTNAIWEPFLEPWSLQIKVVGNTVQVWSTEMMNVNLSWPLLYHMKTFADNWNKRKDKMICPCDKDNKKMRKMYETVKQQQGESHLDVSFPSPSKSIHQKIGNSRKQNAHLANGQPALRVEYYIRNSTGVPLYYWLPGQGPQLLQNCQQKVLIACEPEHIDYSCARTSEMSSCGLISIEIEKYGVIENISISNTGNFVIYRHKRKFIYQVKYFRGSMIVIFTSSLLIHNAANHCVDVLLNRHDVEREILTLDPNQTVTVPLPYVFEESYIRMRPSGFSYIWSREKISTIDVTSRVERLTCPSFVTEQNPFIFMLGIDTDSTPKFKDQHVIRVKPPAILENVLFCSLEYRFFTKHGMLFNRGSLRKGEVISLHNIPLDTIALLSLKLVGYEWSKPVVVSACNGNAHHITLRDSKNRPLRLKIDNRIDSDGCRRIALYSLYWVLNRTGLPLYFGWHKQSRVENVREAAGQTEETTQARHLRSHQLTEWHTETLYRGHVLRLLLNH